MTNQPRSPSELGFASLLVYSPDGVSPISELSRDVVRRIKNANQRYLDRLAARVVEQTRDGCFAGFFGSESILVPVPRSEPTRSSRTAWPAASICKTLIAHGLGREVDPILERTKAVPKSALIRSGDERPGPLHHAGSMSCTQRLLNANADIVLVDDVVTRGATILGAAWVLRDSMPLATLRAFAAVRTMSKQEVLAIVEPVVGRIHLSGGRPKREP